MRLSGFVVAVGLLLVSTYAFGQQPLSGTSGAPVATSSPPDIVVMKDGGILRGTIAEMKPGDTVVIVLITGENRTIQMKNVEYAGPVAERPLKAAAPSSPQTVKVVDATSSQPSGGEARPLVTVHAAEAPFTFTARPDGVTLHLQSGMATARLATGSEALGSAFVAKSYTPICAAPCQATLPMGTHTLALSQGKHVPIEAQEQVRLTGPSKVEGLYKSNQGVRTAGWIVLVGSVAVGSYLMVRAADSGGSGIDSASMSAGGTIMCLGVLAGWLLTTVNDEATIIVSPVAAASLGARTARAGSEYSSTVTRDTALPTGLAMTGIF